MCTWRKGAEWQRLFIILFSLTECAGKVTKTMPCVRNTEKNDDSTENMTAALLLF